MQVQFVRLQLRQQPGKLAHPLHNIRCLIGRRRRGQPRRLSSERSHQSVLHQARRAIISPERLVVACGRRATEGGRLAQKKRGGLTNFAAESVLCENLMLIERIASTRKNTLAGRCSSLCFTCSQDRFNFGSPLLCICTGLVLFGRPIWASAITTSRQLVKRKANDEESDKCPLGCARILMPSVAGASNSKASDDQI